MAFAYVANSAGSAVSTNSQVVNKPTGTADNDIMFALVIRNSNSYCNSVPSGWASLGKQSNAEEMFAEVFWKKAASEGASYTFGFPSSVRTNIVITTYRGGYNLSNPIDVFSNTGYFTVNQTVRAASMTTAAANEGIIWFTSIYKTSSNAFSPPTTPASFTERYDSGDVDSDFWCSVASLLWTGSGATGNMDGTSDTSTNNKVCFAVALNIEVTSTDYPLTAAVGAFTLTGIAANLKLGWKMLGAVGTFTLTGITAGLKLSWKMLGALGTFTLTGIAASLFYGKLLTAVVGEFVLTGVSATITSTRKILANVGTFALTGINAILFVGHTLTAAVGTYTLTGINAIITGARKIVATIGEFTLTGIAALFPRASKVTAVVGTFILTGSNVVFSGARKIVAAVGEFVLTGIAVTFQRASKVFATVGAFTVTGNSATFLVNGLTRTWTAVSKSAVATLSNIAKNAATWINELKS